jgi:hypothetical protein
MVQARLERLRWRLLKLAERGMLWLASAKRQITAGQQRSSAQNAVGADYTHPTLRPQYRLMTFRTMTTTALLSQDYPGGDSL